jgi:multisubunit Na+/H+ antiporter MnhG subunit
MARDIVCDVLLGLAVLVVISASVGVLLMRDPYQKLHYVTPAALVAPALVALAVLVAAGLDENTGETCLALLFIVIAGPFLSHATIRAIRVREKGDWRLTQASKIQASKIQASKIQASKIQASKIQASKIQASKIQASKIQASQAPPTQKASAGKKDS